MMAGTLGAPLGRQLQRGYIHTTGAHGSTLLALAAPARAIKFPQDCAAAGTVDVSTVPAYVQLPPELAKRGYIHV
jgi:hypothetical protein